jgi:putative colanic acid biosynthesis acetyltransferase WcaF
MSQAIRQHEDQSFAASQPRRPVGVSPHSRSHRLGRIFWGFAWMVFFRTSPRPLHRWRNILLRIFGANLHPTARVYPRAKIWAPWNLVMHEHACLADDVDCYAVAPIEIGAYSTISQYSYLCAATHDFEHPDHTLVPLPITIGRRVWIAADVFIAPGVTVGDGAVVGARSSVFSDLPGWTVAIGSPARPCRERGLSPADFGETERDQPGPGPTPDEARGKEHS